MADAPGKWFREKGKRKWERARVNPDWDSDLPVWSACRDTFIRIGREVEWHDDPPQSGRCKRCVQIRGAE